MHVDLVEAPDFAAPYAGAPEIEDAVHLGYRRGIAMRRRHNTRPGIDDRIPEPIRAGPIRPPGKRLVVDQPIWRLRDQHHVAKARPGAHMRIGGILAGEIRVEGVSVFAVEETFDVPR